MSSLNQSTEILVGVGPEIKEEYEKNNIFTVQDLLFVSPMKLARKVAAHLSLKELNRFRSMALLMEINVITPEMADVLVKEKIAKPSDLRLKSASELQALFAAHNLEIDADGIAEIISWAHTLHRTGSLSGKVVDKDKNPVANANVLCGSLGTTTNNMGRFRLSAIPAANRYDVWIYKDGEAPVRFSNQRIGRQDQIQQQVLFEYSPTEITPSSEDEFIGAKISARPKRKRKTKTIDAQLRAFDLLIVHEVKEGTATLVSKFKSADNDEITIYQWTIPVGQFENPPVKGEYYRTNKEGLLRKTKFSRSMLRIISAFKKTKAEFNLRATPQTNMEYEMYITNFNNKLIENCKLVNK